MTTDVREAAVEAGAQALFTQFGFVPDYGRRLAAVVLDAADAVLSTAEWAARLLDVVALLQHRTDPTTATDDGARQALEALEAALVETKRLLTAGRVITGPVKAVGEKR